MKPMTARITESMKILDEYEYDTVNIEDYLRLIAMTYEEYVPSEIVEVATEKFYTGNPLQDRIAITLLELDLIETESKDDGAHTYLTAVIDCVNGYLPKQVNDKLLEIV